MVHCGNPLEDLGPWGCYGASPKLIIRGLGRPMKDIKLFLAVALCLPLTACGLRSTSARLSVQVPDAPPAEVAATANVLLARFETFRQSYFSSVSASIEGNRIDFEFRGKSPSEADLRYLAATRGVYRVAPMNTPLIPWFTDLDIIASYCGQGASSPYLATQLTPAAGAKLLELTRRNPGMTLITTFDGQEIQRATISGVFGERFQSSIPKDEHFTAFCTVMRHGRLPARIGKVEYLSAG